MKKFIFYNAIFTSLLTFLPAADFSQEIPFGQISAVDGLSSNSINCLLQDHLGFLWFGTEDGLNRYDGSDFKIYQNDLNDQGSISDNGIWSLCEDSSGYLWIGTNSGELNRYDHLSDKFTHWRINSARIKENRITAIYQARRGSVWIGTYKDGLYEFSGGKIVNHWQHNNQPNSLSHNYVTSIIEDANGNLWIGTYNGLNRFDPQKYFASYYYDTANPNSISGNLIWNLNKSKSDPDEIWISTSTGLTNLNIKTNVFSRIAIPDSRLMQFGSSIGSVVEENTNEGKIIWCGSYAGLLRINLSTGSFKRFLKKDDGAGLSSNNINYILKDNSGVIWIATLDKGLNFISPKSLKFNNLSWLPVTDEKKYKELNGKNITALSRASDGKVWVGTSEGVYYIGLGKKSLKIILPPLLKNLNVWSLETAPSGDVWIGTYGQGLKQFNLKTGRLISWNIEDPSSSYKNPSFNFIKSIFIDSRGKIWIGCWGPGLVQLDPASRKFKHWWAKEGIPGNLSYGDVWTIHEDNRNRIWIGTNGGGLNLFLNDGEGKFISWTKPNEGNDHSGINDNCIQSICESVKEEAQTGNKETILWIGTNNGLNKLEIINSEENPRGISNLHIRFKTFSIEDGLPGNAVNSIVEDKNGNLWIGTNRGISLMNTAKNKFINFTTSDGLKGNEFNSNAAVRADGSLMIFGSSTGINIFKPDQIFQSDYSPPIFITRFQIFNKEVRTGGDSPLMRNSALAKEVELAYDQNVFSFQFSSLDFNSPKSNRYAYMMEGFDRGWTLSGTRQFITYTNLNPGTYIFRVKGTNSDGIWSRNEASLKVIIDPPWWKSFWAYIGYIFLIAAGIFAIRKIQANRADLENELKMREFEAKKLEELENLKSRFFANLSHEFRTPLMLIKGPVEELLTEERAKGEKKEELEMIRRSSLKLQDLIDQLLELSQLEAASIPLRAKEENIVSLVKGIISFFESLAKPKRINLNFNCSDEKITAWIDREKFEKILNNLLSNAFKFTKPDGTVSVNLGLDLTSGNVQLKIKDTGIGIPDDQKEKVFNRFFQADNPSHTHYGGSGIGLALVKELVELHRWKISLQSELGKGTEFTLLIPLGESYLNENQKILGTDSAFKDKDEEIILNKKYILGGKPGKNLSVEYEKIVPEKASVLIVEDSADVRKYLSGLLKRCYKILEAEDGQSGLKIAAEEMPDIIISDIMMPYMDGLEFCRKIKTCWETSHIPVILLTAKASGESKIEGLETGADDYLIKPFNSKELFVRLKNLLDQRKCLKEKFSKEIKISAENIATNSLDSEFLNKAFLVINKNLADSGFDSEVLANEMFVSRSQLHRKLAAITGQTPGEFIRSCRLKHAAQMLLENKLNVTQIAFEAGFRSSSHFTKAFHQYFNCLPSEFRVKAFPR